MQTLIGSGYRKTIRLIGADAVPLLAYGLSGIAGGIFTEMPSEPGKGIIGKIHLPDS